MPYYVNLSDNGPASGNSGDNPSTPWNFADIQLPGSEVHNDVVYIKGYNQSAPTGALDRLWGASQYLPWADIDDDYMAGYAFPDVTSNWGIIDPSGTEGDVQYSIKGCVCDWALLACPSSIDCCAFLANISDIKFTASADTNQTINAVGSTFDTDLMEFDQPFATRILTANFDACLFRGTEFTTNGQTDIVVNCTNCTFIGKTQAEVEAAFAGTISFTQCRFEVDDFNPSTPYGVQFPGYAEEFAAPDKKRNLNFDFHVNSRHGPSAEDLGANLGYDYSTKGNGVFGGERRGVGCFWFNNTYYAEPQTANSSGTGDGLSEANRFGLTDLQTLFSNSASINGRRLREGDIVKFDNNSVFQPSSAMTFPNNFWNPLLDFGADPALHDHETTTYVKIEPVGDNPFVLDLDGAAGSVDHFGYATTVERFVINADSATQIVTNEEHNFWICVFFNLTELKFLYNGNATYTGRSDFEACTIVSPKITVECPNNREMYLRGTVIPRINGSEPQLYAGTAIGNVHFSRSVTTNNKTDFVANFISNPSNTYDDDFGDPFYYNRYLKNPMPTVLSDYYNEAVMDYWNYNVNESFNTSTSFDFFDYGLFKFSQPYGRYGGGAFAMSGTQPTHNVWYFDADKVAEGVGTEADPFNQDQLVLYAAGGLEEYYGFNFANIRGTVNQTTDKLLPLTGDFQDVTYQAWDLAAYGMWKIEINNPGNETTVFDVWEILFTSFINDCAILAPTGSCSLLNLVATPDYTFYGFNNCILIADVPVVITKADFPITYYQNTPMNSCTISIGPNASTFKWSDDEIYNNFSNMVFNIDPSVVISKGVNAQIAYDYSETNRSELDMLIDTSIAPVFDNTNADGPLKIPTSRDSSSFTIDELIFQDYVILNPGDPVTWHPTGVGGTPRQGIGAFFFGSANEYYIDLDALDEGDGTQQSPWNVQQMQTYLDNGAGGDIGSTIPVGGDVLKVRGNFEVLNGTVFFTMNRSWSGSVTIEAWDIGVYGPWFIYDDIDDGSQTVMFYRYDGTGDLIVKDFFWSHSNASTNIDAVLFRLLDTASSSLVEFSNFNFASRYDEIFRIQNATAAETLTVNLKGFNIDCSSMAVSELNTVVNMYDGALKTSPVEVWGTTNINHCEMTADSGDFSPAVNFVDCTFNSTSPNLLPGYLLPEDYDKVLFDYSVYGFENEGMGSGFWESNNYNYGLNGETRLGLGFFFYFIPIPAPVTPDPKPTKPCEEPPMEGRKFWDWLTTFWGFLTDEDRDMFENFWSALTFAGNSLIKKGLRFYEAQAPENARVCVLDDYYDLQVGPMYSKPIDLDPTIKSPNYIVKPLRTVLVTPEYDVDSNPVYRHLIQITAKDYQRLREVALGTYVIVQVKREGVSDRYFKVNNLLSSDEPVDRPASCEIGWDTIENLPNKSATITESGMGRVRLTSLDHTEDVSKYKILCTEATVTSSVTWYTDGVHIQWFPGDSVDDVVDQINATDPNRWAEAKNISSKSGIYFPVWGDETFAYPADAHNFDEFSNYIVSEEANGRYYPPTGLVWRYFDGYTESDGEPGTEGVGEWVKAQSKYQYFVEVQGDLTYIGVEAFTVYFTSGLAYDIQPQIMDVPVLQNFIESGIGVQFKKVSDYTFSYQTSILEFNEDIFASGAAESGEYFYCPKAPQIENYLFELYGGMISIPDWKRFNYDRFSGKSGVNTILKGLQEATNATDYERALNAYFGLPVSPEKSEVIGLFESYGYPVVDVSGNVVSVEIKQNSELHPFVQPISQFYIEGKKNAVVASILNRYIYDFSLNKHVAQIQMDDASHIEPGDQIHLKLNNRLIAKDFIAETETEPAYINVYSPEGAAWIQHLIDTVYVTSNGTRYPEIVVYGTGNLDYNFDGTYHITKAELVGGYVRLTVYQKPTSSDPLYNDFVGETIYDVDAGFIHIPWPTHKFLLLLLDVDQYYKAYLDSPIDTIYDVGNTLEKYQTIARNVSVLTSEKFPGWTEFSNFRKFSGINIESDILELTSIIPGAEFGSFFPSGYSETQ